MKQELLKDTRVTWISHRGNALAYPENTADSFDSAMEDGFPVLETDLRPTSDGQIVLSHDRSLLRVAGIEQSVDQLTRSELEKVRLEGGRRLLFLDEFIDRYRSVEWVFDLKPEKALLTIRNLESLFRNRRDRNLVLEKTRVLCWNSKHERLMRSELGFHKFFARKWQCIQAAMSVLYKLPALGGIEKEKAYGILPKVTGLSLFKPSVIDQYHRRGALVIAFLPDFEEAKEAIEAGVDMILMDYAAPE